MWGTIKVKPCPFLMIARFKPGKILGRGCKSLVFYVCSPIKHSTKVVRQWTINTPIKNYFFTLYKMLPYLIHPCVRTIKLIHVTNNTILIEPSLTSISDVVSI